MTSAREEEAVGEELKEERCGNEEGLTEGQGKVSGWLNVPRGPQHPGNPARRPEGNITSGRKLGSVLSGSRLSFFRHIIWFVKKNIFIP